MLTDRGPFARIPAGTDLPRAVNVIVEIPRGRRSKFEVDPATGLIRLDRYLYSSSHYPGDYGFIPQTLAEDGDNLDVLVMVNEPTFSGCLIQARVIGLFKMTDRNQHDYKVLAVPNSDPLFAEYQDLQDVPKHYLREVEHFFMTYKQLEGVNTEPHGWGDAGEASQEVHASVDRYMAELARRAKSGLRHS
ncbi:MAG: inorganic diphosphatase [Phycisphaerales bacterium]|nr:inorganic diphosphatase [Phycisphaerales bacterium]